MVSSHSYFLGANQVREEYGIPVSDDSFISASYRPVPREVIMPDGTASKTDESFIVEDAQEITVSQAWTDSAYIPSLTFPAYVDYALLTNVKIRTQAGKLATVEITLLFPSKGTVIVPESTITLPSALNTSRAAVMIPALTGLVAVPEHIYESIYEASCGYQLVHRSGELVACLAQAPSQKVSFSLSAGHVVLPTTRNGWLATSGQTMDNSLYSLLNFTAEKTEKTNMALFRDYNDGKRVLTPEYTTTREETNVISIVPALGGVITVTKTIEATHYEEEYVFLSASAAEACVAAVRNEWTKTWSDQVLSSNTTMDETGLWNATISVETKQRTECVADISTSIDHATGAYTVSVSVNWERLSCSSNASTVSGRLNSLVGTNAVTA